MKSKDFWNKQYKKPVEKKLLIAGENEGDEPAEVMFSDMDDDVKVLYAKLEIVQKRRPKTCKLNAKLQARAEYNTAKTPLKGRKFLNIHGTADTVIPYAGGSHAFGYSFLEAQNSVYQVAKSQGYTGGIIPDAGGVYYGVTGVYYYSYLAGQVLHYKTNAAHGVEDYMKQIVGNQLTYTQASAPAYF